MWRPFARDTTGLDEAKAARARAEADLTATVNQTPAFRALAESLREMRERNHFAESIRESMRPR